MADNKYAWNKAPMNVGNAGNVRGAITQWSRTTVADGLWMNNEQLLPLSGRDQYLLDSINDLESHSTGDVEWLEAKINTEITRAENAENVLTVSLNNEINRASTEESTIRTELSNETSRATTQETSLFTMISDETGRALQKELEIDNRLTGEIDRSVEEDNKLSNDISNEVTRATSMETTLFSTISDESSRAISEENHLNELYTNLDEKVSDTVSITIGDGLNYAGGLLETKITDGNCISASFNDGYMRFDLLSELVADDIATNTLSGDSIYARSFSADDVLADVAEYNHGIIDTVVGDKLYYDEIYANNMECDNITAKTLVIDGYSVPKFSVGQVSDEPGVITLI